MPTSDNIQFVLSLANLTALIGISVVGFKIVRHMARMEMMVDLMWSDFRKRFPYARAEDTQ